MAPSLRNFALTACVLCSFCIRFNLALDESECVAQATAGATELEAAAEAVSNAVAATLTKTINCETGELEDSGTSLSFALALAISVAREIGENCTADADAQAGLAGELVGREVLLGLENVESDKKDSRVFDASARALGETIPKAVEESNVDEAQAEEIARQIFDAAKEILTALTCDGKNVDAGTGDCIFVNGRFVGDCLGPSTPAPTQPRAQRVSASNCVFLNGRTICN